MQNLKLECDNFDWNDRNYDDYDNLFTKMYELEDTITLNVICSIDIDKTI